MNRAYMESVTWMRFDRDNIPGISGVYAFKLRENWLYIGKADNLKKRLSVNTHIAFRMTEGLSEVQYLYIPSNDPLTLEKLLIKLYQPDWKGLSSFPAPLLTFDEDGTYYSGVWCHLSEYTAELKRQEMERLKHSCRHFQRFSSIDWNKIED